jgi:hypothetical protein
MAFPNFGSIFRSYNTVILDITLQRYRVETYWDPIPSLPTPVTSHNLYLHNEQAQTFGTLGAYFIAIIE